MNNLNGLKTYIGLALALLFIIALFVIPSLKKTDTSSLSEGEETPEIIHVNSFKNLSVDAKSVYIFDVCNEEVIYEKESEAQLPLASLAKLVSALVAVETIPPSSVIVSDASSLALEGDNGILVGEKWGLKDLLDLTLITSSNDGINVLALAAGSYINDFESSFDPRLEFIKAMNKKAQDLGLTQTFFINESGLDFEDDGISGSYGSAKDMANLFSYIIKNKPDVIEATGNQKIEVTSLSNITHEAVNTNTAIDAIPWVIGSKTGFTDLAGGNLVVAFDAGIAHPIVAVVLGSTQEGRFEDMEKLVDATFKHLSLQK